MIYKYTYIQVQVQVYSRLSYVIFPNLCKVEQFSLYGAFSNGAALLRCQRSKIWLGGRSIYVQAFNQKLQAQSLCPFMLKVFCAILKTAPFFVNCSTSGDNLSGHGCHCCAGQIRKNIVLLLLHFNCLRLIRTLRTLLLKIKCLYFGGCEISH